MGHGVGIPRRRPSDTAAPSKGHLSTLADDGLAGRDGVPATAMNSGVRWVRWGLRLLAVGLIVAGCMLFTVHPTVRYTGYSGTTPANMRNIELVAHCPRAFDSAPLAPVVTYRFRHLAEVMNYDAAYWPCQHATSRVRSWGWALIAGGAVLIGASLLPWRRQPQRASGAVGKDPSPSLQGTSHNPG